MVSSMSGTSGSTMEEGYTTLSELRSRVATGKLTADQQARWVRSVAEKAAANGRLLTDQQYADLMAGRTLQAGDSVRFVLSQAQGFVRRVYADGSVDIFVGNERKHVTWKKVERIP